MNRTASRPGRLRYLIGVSIILIAVVVGAVIIGVQVNSSLPDIRFVVPGTHETYLGEAGKYTIWYEYRSVVDGTAYATEATRPSMTLQVRPVSDEQQIGLSTPRYNGSYSTPRYSALSLVQFSIDEPGTYALSADYADAAGGPDVVLSVGPAGQVASSSEILTLLGVGVATLIAVAIGVTIIVTTFLRRRNSDFTIREGGG